MPSGKVDLPLIEDNRDGTVRVQYDPKEEGVHELVILYNGVPVEGKCNKRLSTFVCMNVQIVDR